MQNRLRYGVPPSFYVYRRWQRRCVMYLAHRSWLVGYREMCNSDGFVFDPIGANPIAHSHCLLLCVINIGTLLRTDWALENIAAELQVAACPGTYFPGVFPHLGSASQSVTFCKAQQEFTVFYISCHPENWVSCLEAGI